MRILDRYIGQAVLIGVLAVLVVLMALYGLIGFVNEFSQIGRGSYTAWNAMVYVLLLIPHQLYQLFPMAALLGTMIGLGMLANHRELVVIRAAGVSRLRIAWAVIKSMIMLIVLVMVVGELLAPPALQYANQTRLKAMAARLSLNTDYGLWARDGNTYIHVRNVEHDGRLVDINLYTLDEKGALQTQLHADTARFDGKLWQMQNVQEIRISHEGLKIDRKPTLAWQTLLEPELVNIVSLAPESLAIWKLYDYIQYLRSNGLDSEQYELALWGKLIMPFTILAMVMLALPFVFRSERHISIGRQIIIGFLVGIVFYIASQLAAQVGLVYNLWPAVAATLPTLLVWLIAIGLLRKF
jgi:lipopolysaccharide export system permease protein